MTFLQWLKSLFAAPVAPVLPVAPQRKGKVALVVGHNARAKGAQRVTDGRSEYDWNIALAEMIRGYAPDQYRIFLRPAGKSYTTEIRETYAAVDAWGADASVELHFNGAAPGATGTETLLSGSGGSVRLADLMQHEMVKALGLRNRGNKVKGAKDRGGASLHAGKAPAVMIEPYFGSNAADCAAADKHIAALVAGIHRACMAFLNEVKK